MNLGITNKPLRWEYLYELDFEIEIAISALKKLNINQEKSLKSAMLSFNNVVKNNKQILENLPADEQASYDFHLHYIDDRIIKDLQRLQRYSLVIIIFSVFESRLLSLCTELSKEFPQLPPLNKKNNKPDLERYWQYLTETMNLNVIKLEALFQRFDQQKFLRNCLVHHDGIVSNKNKITIIKGISLSDFGKNSMIEIEENIFVVYLLKYLKEFFCELTEKVDDKYIELKKHKFTKSTK